MSLIRDLPAVLLTAVLLAGCEIVVAVPIIADGAKPGLVQMTGEGWGGLSEVDYGFDAARVVRAQVEIPPAQVMTTVVCPLDRAQKDFVAIQAADVHPNTDECLVAPFPVALDILEVIAGPTTDFEGDVMFLVRVMLLVRVDVDAYTIAWPGFNSDLGPDGKVGHAL